MLLRGLTYHLTSTTTASSSPADEVLPTGVYQRQTDVNEDRISLSLKSKQAPTKKWTATEETQLPEDFHGGDMRRIRKTEDVQKNNKI